MGCGPSANHGGGAKPSAARAGHEANNGQSASVASTDASTRPHGSSVLGRAKSSVATRSAQSSQGSHTAQATSQRAADGCHSCNEGGAAQKMDANKLSSVRYCSKDRTSCHSDSLGCLEETLLDAGATCEAKSSAAASQTNSARDRNSRILSASSERPEELNLEHTPLQTAKGPKDALRMQYDRDESLCDGLTLVPPAGGSKDALRMQYESDESLREEAVNSLRLAIGDDHTVAGYRDDRVLLLQCLRAKAYDQGKALSCLINFCKFRQKHSLDNSLLARVRRELLTRTYRIGGRARGGGRVVCMKPSHIEMFAGATIENYQFAGYYILEQLFRHDAVAQVEGLALVVDFVDFGWTSYFRLCKLPDVQRAVSMLQDCFPMRVSLALLLNQPSWISMFFRLLSPLLSKHSFLHTRLQMLGTRVDAIYEFIEPSELSDEFGGTLQLIWPRWLDVGNEACVLESGSEDSDSELFAI